MMRRSVWSFAAAASSAEPYDVVVVGGGSSGVLTASRFANTNLRTLLIEQGPNVLKDAPSWHYTMPAAKVLHRVKGRYQSRENLTTPQKCFTGWGAGVKTVSASKEDGEGPKETAATQQDVFFEECEEKQTFRLPTAEVLGGSGIMGSKTWIRATKTDIANLPGTHVDEENLLSYYKKLENVDQEDNHAHAGYRGVHGRLFQTRPNTANPLYKPFSESVAHQHFAHVADLNKADAKMIEGTGRPESMTNPFNYRAANVITNVLQSCVGTKRPLELRCNTTVKSLNCDGGNTVKTIETVDSKGTISSVQATSVVICAGAVGSARILTHPDTHKTLPQATQALPIGHNYWAIPSVVLDYPTTTNDSLQCWLNSPLAQKMEEWYTWRHTRSIGAGGYDDMLLHMLCPRKQFDPKYGTQTADSKVAEQLWTKTILQPFRVHPKSSAGATGLSVPSGHGFQLSVNLMTPKSRGTVGWNVEKEKVEINPNYFDEAIDTKALQDAVGFASNLCRSSRQLGSIIDWDRVDNSKNSSNLGTFEPTSQCGGTVSLETCVDPETFTVKGMSNLFVSGSAVLPNPTEGDSVPLSLALTEMLNDRMLRL